MKKYVICTDHGEDRSAATKARKDAEDILLSQGYEPVSFQIERTADGDIRRQILLVLKTVSSWLKMTKGTEAGSLMILQYPVFPIKTVYILGRLLSRTKKKKGIRFVALVHDLNSIRGFYGKAGVYSDTCFLKLFDHIITHNRKMTEYLVKSGFPKDKLTELGLFDYLTDAEDKEHRLRDGIAIAGKLDPEKSGYVRELASRGNESLTIHLYGTGLDGREEAKGIVYHGTFPPDVLPGEAEGAFGLIWDGPSAQTCSGRTGEYLRYNNPHKLSLYLAAGMPVIIWREAAEADFVRENGLGLLTDSIGEIPGLIGKTSENAYEKMKDQVRKIRKKVREGAYLRAALIQAEQKLKA